MRHQLAVAALTASAGLALAAEGVEAQIATPEAVISFAAGIAFPGAYWRLDAQPVTSGSGLSALDTFTLAQRFAHGPALTVSITRFVRPTIGLGVEGTWIRSTAETSCAMRGAVTPDPEQLTRQICATLDRLRLGNSAIAAQGVVVLRPARARHVRPYLRAGAGIAVLGRGLYYLRVPVWTAGCEGCLRTILDAPAAALTWTATLAAGVTLGTGHTSRFRVEVRDAILSLPTITGPASPYGESPLPATRSRPIHRLLVSVGADLVFGGPRARRY